MSREKELVILGERLKALRKCLGLSRKTAAKELGVSEAGLIGWESGRSDIGVVRFAAYLGIFRKGGIDVSFEDFVDFEKPAAFTQITKI